MNHDQTLINGAISNKTFRLRDVNIMLDYDLAELYEVETKQADAKASRI